MTVHFNTKRQRWTYDFVQRKERHQGYCLDAAGQPVTSRSAAKQAEGVARRLAQMAPKLPQGDQVSLGQVIADLQPRWMREADWPNKKRIGRELVTFFGSAMPITAIDADQIRRYTDFALAQPIRVWRGGHSMERDEEGAEAFWKPTSKTRSPATVNRYLAVLRLILGRATTMRDPLTQAPVLERMLTIKDLAEPKRRARPTPEPVLQRLMQILPPHLVDATILTLYFGFRRGEAFGLTEQHVDWHAGGVRLFAEDVKDAKDTFLPGSLEAMGYLRCLAIEADQRGGVTTLISFRQETRAGSEYQQAWRSIKSPKRAWRTAMKTIEAEFGRRWRWHDLRAAFITHVAMMCGPLAAQTMARHADFDTTRAYIEVADETRRIAADRAGDRPSLRIVGEKKTP